MRLCGPPVDLRGNDPLHATLQAGRDLLLFAAEEQESPSMIAAIAKASSAIIRCILPVSLVLQLAFVPCIGACPTSGCAAVTPVPPAETAEAASPCHQASTGGKAGAHRTVSASGAKMCCCESSSSPFALNPKQIPDTRSFDQACALQHEAARAFSLHPDSRVKCSSWEPPPSQELHPIYQLDCDLRI